MYYMISSYLMKMSTAVVIPNWNGEENLSSCLDSLLNQSCATEIIVVENGSTDRSLTILSSKYETVTVLAQSKNLGFAGGVNIGLRYAIEKGYEYVALFNNDAVANINWLEHLIKQLDLHSDVGITTCKLLTTDKIAIDSSGELYTSWGLPYPRGRDERDLSKYDNELEIFGASGGASLYRIEMLKEIGLFDEDFFAYYEDVDLSFRAQLAGWKVRYEPKAEAYHQIGATSGKIKGFTTYQTLKNLPWVYWKNVPFKIAVPMFPKIFFAYWTIFLSACMKGKLIPAIKGALVCHVYMIKKLFIERRKIQKNRKVSNDYINSILIHDVPPNAHKLRKIRSIFVK